MAKVAPLPHLAPSSLLGRSLSLMGVALALSGCKDARKQHGPPPANTSVPAPAVSSASAPVPSGSSLAPAEHPREPLNVLLISIDSLRVDVPWLGYARPIAPNLTRLAAESVVYTRAYAASSYTAKSVATMLSGRYASTLYRDGRFFARYASSNRFLAEVLGERGIRSVGWQGHFYFDHRSGFEQGFSEWKLVPGITVDAETDQAVTSEKMTALGIELLSKPENTAGRFFAWGHYMDPHDQYLTHAEAPKFGKKARDRYDSEIWFTDLWLGKLLDFARAQPWWSRTALIVTADHGEAFGEHGMYKHAFELWEVLTRVPLLILVPGASARRIEERRSHVDLAPTILELMGVPVPAEFQGSSLVPELYGAAPASREPILCELAEDTHNAPRRALIRGPLKLIDFGRGGYQLFNLEEDPGELSDIAPKHPAELTLMKQELEKKYARLPTVAPFGGQKLHDGGRANGPSDPGKSSGVSPQ